ncbi:hypothetical protein CRM22_005679 [Opisthorchis felineus]|uniref:G-protein coupled receptors family 1 profile domain-containing protein n=1 Tax=Opisthorchis felineus TaxID=147828 RepID=A0A4S2LX07_OPIFE|nr:hypothetical protein CRM22_005679 [Opisthorchis felineus]
MTIPLPCLFVCHVVIGPMGKTYCQEIWPRTPENYSNFTASDRWSILSINGTRPYEELPDFLSSPLEFAYGLTLLLFQYAIPLTVITGTYVAIVYRIWGKRPPGECDVQRDEKRSTAKKRLVKMVIIVATLYAVSQLPRHVVYLVTLNNADAFRQETMMYTWLFCQLCTWSATCYNPFIYSWMNRTFRRGMVDLLRRALCLRQFRILSRLSRRGTQSPDTFIEFDPMITQAHSSDKEDGPVEMEKYS